MEIKLSIRKFHLRDVELTKGDWIKYEDYPYILFICPNDEIEKDMVKKVKLICDEEDVSDLTFFTSTQEQIRKYGITGR